MTPPNNLASQFRATGKTTWQSWHENFTQRNIKEFLDVWNTAPQRADVAGYNATTAALQSKIAQALAAHTTLRAIGGGWSFSDIAATDGIMLNTRPLNYTFRVQPRHLHPNYLGNAAHLRFCQCGTTIAYLNDLLRAENQALKTSGASNGQTIVGALSTGTHGSAYQFGAIPDYVVALHLLVASDQSIWLEPADKPIVKDTFAAAFNATVIRDTNLFNAALVSLGSFGLIHGAMIETSDLYYLTVSRKRLPLDAAMWNAITTLDLNGLNLPRPSAELPHHFGVVINPFDLNRGVYATVMYKDPARPVGTRSPEPSGGLTQGDSTLSIVGALLDLVSDLTPTLTNTLLSQVFRDTDGVSATPGKIFADTTLRGKAFSSAMGIPSTRAKEAIEIVLNELKNYEAPVLIGLRFVKASRATLSFTHHAPITCVLEIDGPLSVRVRTLSQRVWSAFAQTGIPYTFHWGKCNDLDAANVRQMYGDQRISSWIKARRAILTTPALRAVFSNEYLRRMNMHG